MSQQLTPNVREVIKSSKELRDYVMQNVNRPYMVLSVWSDGLDPHSCSLKGISISFPNRISDYCRYIPFCKDSDLNINKVFSYDEVREYLAPLIDTPVVMHNSLFDIPFINKFLNLPVKCMWDTAVAARVINSQEPHIKLVNLYLKYCNPVGFDINNVPECRMIDSLYTVQKGILFYDPNQPYSARNGMNGAACVYHEIELPLLSVLSDLTLRGISVDTSLLDTIIAATDLDEELTETGIFKLIRDYMLSKDCACPDVCQKVIDKAELIPSNSLRTVFEGILHTRLPNLGLDVMKRIDHPIAKAYVKLRRQSNDLHTLNTFKASVIEDKVYPMYMSCKHSICNISTQMPKVSTLSYNMQNLLVASDDHYMCTAIFPKLLFYVFAALLPEPYTSQILDLLEGDRDYYAVLASKIYSMPYEDCLDRSVYRHAVKYYIISTLFGQTDKNRRAGCNLSNDEYATLQLYINREFPALDIFVQESVAICKSCGYVTTIGGRRIPEPDIWLDFHDPDLASRYDDACRRCVSERILGSIVDLKKSALIQLHNDPVLASFGYKILTVSYDDIVGECDKETALSCQAILRRKLDDCVRNLFGIRIPCEVEITNCLYGEEIQLE